MSEILNIQNEVLRKVGLQTNYFETVGNQLFVTQQAILQAEELGTVIDHTLLSPSATPAMIEKLCEEANTWQVASVCINSMFVPLAKQKLIHSSVKVCSVVGFPLGATSTDAKSFEANWAVENGAEEIDMVLPIGQLKSGDWEFVLHDIQSVRSAIGKDVTLKVIIETGLLNDLEKVAGTVLSILGEADFVKTSTGFNGGGATIEDVLLLRQVAQNRAKIKAAGGIHDTAKALALVKAGAHRLGSSHTQDILNF